MPTQTFARFLAAFFLQVAVASVFAAPTVKDVSFVNNQKIKITGKLYLPDSVYSPSPVAVLMHGCSGIYSYSDPARGIAVLYREWATRLNNAGYAALLIDSFTPRNVNQNQCDNGTVGVSEINDRPFDAYAAQKYLSQQRTIDAARIVLIGWSHGASSTLATLSDTMVNPGEKPYKAGYAFYPGCGLFNAFGGISTSTYKPYVPLTILHGDADPLYQSGYCQQRIDKAMILGVNIFSMTVFSGAQHSFDMARSAVSPWTVYDLNAKVSADSMVMQSLLQTFKK
ncbi:MAG: dienelactone hydrolase family protein [Massilia sp.]|nr:dienelactone hydrolase family protein [Massilia sp.]